ncbi:MAG: hypothetical protein WDO71_01065 [Bacteroidota bacterium]
MLVSPLTALADPSDPFFVQHYDNRNGLSNSSINHIFKDAGNLLWIATWDGLNMYDGTSFHVFNYSKENDFKSIGATLFKILRKISQGISGSVPLKVYRGLKSIAGNFITISITTTSGVM